MKGNVALRQAGHEFGARLELVQEDQWSHATPCDQWTVRDLVNHVVGGNFRYAMILHGENPSTVLATHDDDFLGSDPDGAFWSGFQRVTEAFDTAGALSRTIHHPKSGTMSGADLRVLRVSELSIHAWDLARAINVDQRLDGKLVRWLHDHLDPMREMIGASGLYAPPEPSRDPPESLQTRLLEMLGRRS